ncbi:hypothetical protein TNCV_263271 [Trichonephila clavipes]|nr:hypothetical protein TNCV_263271 [Trichonephila clavipes]
MLYRLDKLKIGSSYWIRSLEQLLSISFTKEGELNSTNMRIMQVSLCKYLAENLQEELDLRHVENRQIKKELLKS